MAVPLERRIARVRTVFRLPEGERPPRTLEEELDRLESRYELFKIDFFNQYRWCVTINTLVAFALAVILVVIAIKADDVIADGFEWFPILAIALSFLPAPPILAALWFDARRQVKALEDVADDIEVRALQAAG